MTDGKQLAMWVYEWEHDRASQLTLNPAQIRSRYGQSTGAESCSGRPGYSTESLLERADGTGDAQRLTHSPYPQSAASWHPGGKSRTFQETCPQAGDDCCGCESKARGHGLETRHSNEFLEHRRDQTGADAPLMESGWRAGQMASGQFEIYVRPFPGPGGSG